MSVRGGGKKYSLWYVGKIIVNPKLKEFKIVVIGEASSQYSVPQSRYSTMY